MNIIIVLSLAAVAATGSAQLLGYPFGYSAYAGYPTPYSSIPPTYAGYAGIPTTYAGYAGIPTTYSGYAGIPTSAVTYSAAAPAFSQVAYAAAPVTPVLSQYHAQDELGQYSFGYGGGPSNRQETKDAFGIVRGSYNYVDPEGKVQATSYVADALGFRVAATNLPVAPAAPSVAQIAGPEPVQDTIEVAEAKEAHRVAYAASAEAAAAAPDSRKKRSAPVVAVHSPLRFSYGFQTPLHYSSFYPSTYSAAPFSYGVAPSATSYTATASAPLTYAAAAPAALTYSAAPAALTYSAAPAALTYSAAAPIAALRDAELLRVVNNPGHAVSYRVD